MLIPFPGRWGSWREAGRAFPGGRAARGGEMRPQRSPTSRAGGGAQTLSQKTKPAAGMGPGALGVGVGRAQGTPTEEPAGGVGIRALGLFWGHTWVCRGLALWDC